ncbi:MAG: UDP-N-acetylmuramoyl-tripeptide--D-alanyl-D-alanine ligase [Cyclobacteriaceae bacterium]
MGDFMEFLYSRFLLSDGVSIDTRTIEKGNLFFAINGPNFNAAQFAMQALEKGASYVVVDDVKYVTDDRIILAEDSLKALQDLARFHRARFKRPVLGITGSNGKTTTKELISRVLSKKFVVHTTKGNYNNHIGVPLTLLHIHPQVEIAVIEMGANHVGEIGFLSEMAAPTYGLITNIGHAHTEGFGGIEGVLRGKSELFDYLRKTEGKPLINTDDPRLVNMVKRFADPITFPDEDVKLLDNGGFATFEMGGKKIVTNLIGSYNFSNIAAAIAVGRTFEVSDADIREAITSYLPENARSQIIKKGSATIIMDAYNANPDSMKAALRSLQKMEGKKVAILGDMNELENPVEAHQEILDLARDLKIDTVLTVGEKIGRAKNGNHHFGQKSELISFLDQQKFPESNVLLKASRSIKLETIVENINP